MQYNVTNLIMHSGGSADPEVIVEVTPEAAGWEFIHFQARRLEHEHSWSYETGEFEVAVVLLSGSMQVDLPGFDCHRLVVVEVYTPSGGWSSYPPHKHDVHREDEGGNLLEADLEEVYYYKQDRPGGYAYRRVYIDENSPLHRAGKPIGALLLVRQDDVVLVPEGYHPVVSPPGYTTYYLNVLAGSAQSLANVDDPAYSWVKGTFTSRKPAVPVYSI